MNVPFVDLRAQYLSLKPEIDAAIQSVLDRSAFILGREVDEFESAFGQFIGIRHTVSVSSGTDALVLALTACGVGPGDEVITTPNTFIATCEAITRVGAQIRWVDVDPRTYTLDPAHLAGALSPRTRAIVPVHLYGLAADMGPIMAFASANGLRVIEDCAQAHGATYRGRAVGTFGDAACFSFYPAKNLGAFGDGGAVVTNDDRISGAVRLLRNHGVRDKHMHLVEGQCHRLDNLQAAVLCVKLPHLAQWNSARRRVAAWYTELLRSIPEITAPLTPAESEHVFHLYVVQVPRRSAVQAALEAAGVETGIHYPIPLHQQPAYARLSHHPDDFPVATRLGPAILSLPMYPELSCAQVEHVVQSLRLALRS